MSGSRKLSGFISILVWLLLTALVLCSFAHAPSDSVQSRFDGPAELPRLYVKSSLKDTPAPGKILTVREGGNLQAAIDGAKCGDILMLQAGAIFRGLFRLPEKPCDDAHWIVLRTSAPDDSLPAEGMRLTPCYGGVASLPGRPDFRCASARNVLTKIEFDGKGANGPILFLQGANHYRFIGLEITRAQSEMRMRHLAQPAEKATAHHLVFDRVWMHGTAQDETKGGLHLSGTSYVAVVDSYFSDFHCIARTGSCTDAQAINGGGGDAPGGPYKIVNNFLEASGENILFGGAPATTTPADIEIRHNHLFKPMNWKPDQPGFIGSTNGNPFIVKNHFELKNAQRVLFEGNVLENVWGGFTQAGFSILLTPVNQADKCPQCRVTDVTIRYNKVRHVGSAIQLATALSKFKTSASAGERYMIHDLLVDDIQGQSFKGSGAFIVILSVQPPIKDVSIEHVTAFPPGVLMSILNSGEQRKLVNFRIANNLFGTGGRQIASAGGGPTNCAARFATLGPAGVLNSCFADAVFTHNLIVGSSGNWPSSNIVLKDAEAAGIRNTSLNSGGDYRLCRLKGEMPACNKSSPALRGATDGKDIGADIDAIEKATANVM